jgi:hypothetical protein
VTETEMLAPQGPDTRAVTESWDIALPDLRQRFPKASDGVLFCVYKLLQDRRLRMRDFRDEGRVRGITMSGRSYHTAKVLLGLEKREVTPVAKAAAGRRAPRPVNLVPPSRGRLGATPDRAGTGSLEDQLNRALRMIQENANAEADRLRTAIRQAIGLLEKALGE